MPAAIVILKFKPLLSVLQAVQRGMRPRVLEYVRPATSRLSTSRKSGYNSQPIPFLEPHAHGPHYRRRLSGKNKQPV